MNHDGNLVLYSMMALVGRNIIFPCREFVEQCLRRSAHKVLTALVAALNLHSEGDLVRGRPVIISWERIDRTLRTSLRRDRGVKPQSRLDLGKVSKQI